MFIAIDSEATYHVFWRLHAKLFGCRGFTGGIVPLFEVFDRQLTESLMLGVSTYLIRITRRCLELHVRYLFIRRATHRRRLVAGQAHRATF